jgi:hypothetical protein
LRSFSDESSGSPVASIIANSDNIKVPCLLSVINACLKLKLNKEFKN